MYSIDEYFIDVTSYLNTYHMTAHELAKAMIREVLYQTGITATTGIGTNLYLSKVAMDIVAKHVPADKDGVRIAELNERTYRELLWCHTPLTDFWNIGSGIAERVAELGCFTMGDIARHSMTNGEALYKKLGVKAELVIDHAWGWEPIDIPTIRSYHPGSSSMSTSHVLKEPYTAEMARLVTREMTEELVMDMVRSGVVTKKLTLTISYDRTSLSPSKLVPGKYVITGTDKLYTGKIGKEMVDEEARQVGTQDTLSETEIEILNQKLSLIADVIEDGYKPEVTITYFVQDARKHGGEYCSLTAKVRRIDIVNRQIELCTKVGVSGSYMRLAMDKVKDISGDLVDHIE